MGPQGDGQFALKDFTRYDYLADATYYVGPHNLKAGFGFQRVDANVLRDQSGGQLVNVLGPTDDGQTIYSHTFFASPDATIENPTLAPVVATPQNNVFAVYLQDRWEILRNLTVNAGVRWEKQEIQGPRRHHVHQRRSLLAAGRRHLGLSQQRQIQGVRLLQRVRAADPDGHERPVAERRTRRLHAELQPDRPGLRHGGLPGRLHHPRQARRRHRPEPEVALFEGDPGRRRDAVRDQLGRGRQGNLPGARARARGHLRSGGRLRQLRLLQPGVEHRGAVSGRFRVHLLQRTGLPGRQALLPRHRTVRAEERLATTGRSTRVTCTARSRATSTATSAPSGASSRGTRTSPTTSTIPRSRTTRTAT